MHCEGAVVGEVRLGPRPHRDFRGFGGSVFNFDHHTALELATRLFYLGSGPVAAVVQVHEPDGGLRAPPAGT